MRFLQSYKIFESINIGLEKELKYFDILSHSLNEDGSIDVNCNTNLSNKDLNKIPFNFNKVNGYFAIRNNKLTTLKNCPKYIDKQFDCSRNKLTSLELGPEYVGSNYWCDENELTTLNGCVDEVYGSFGCRRNKLVSLEYCPMQVEGHFYCSNNKLEYLDRSPFVRGFFICQGMFKSEPEFNGSCEKLVWNINI